MLDFNVCIMSQSSHTLLHDLSQACSNEEESLALFNINRIEIWLFLMSKPELTVVRRSPGDNVKMKPCEKPD